MVVARHIGSFRESCAVEPVEEGAFHLVEELRRSLRRRDIAPPRIEGDLVVEREMEADAILAVANQPLGSERKSGFHFPSISTNNEYLPIGERRSYKE